MAVSGIHIGWGIGTPRLREQQWHTEAAQTGQLFVILSWYIGALIGCLLVLSIFRHISKKGLYVCAG